ncbi:hypothetical protein T07_9452 [Trichinella nelsoni]|uniref:Uncharacterized protein n=1 Tax=Trichinella nelsoni TaxID=6336 RepID=A0A0V0SDN0_9BILA|nr:hypothetical protein T07_9452 [Trichinella nelsoni]
MEIRFPFSVHQLSKVVNCIDPCGTMRCILLEDKQAVSAPHAHVCRSVVDRWEQTEWVGLVRFSPVSLPASFAVGIRRSKLTSETFDQSAERLRRDQLCEQCAKLAPKLPG